MKHATRPLERRPLRPRSVLPSLAHRLVVSIEEEVRTRPYLHTVHPPVQ